MSSADVVVVGSGGAGLVAALAGATTGARVTLLERAPVFGGTTAISGGCAWLPGNSAGAALGFEDVSEEVRTYLDRVIFGRVAERVLDAGVFGPAYPGRGSTLGPALTFGYIAGRSAVSQ